MTAQADAWTIARACAELNVDEARFGMAVTRVARIPRAGEEPSGGKGGRGRFLYPEAELRRLHAALAPWLTKPRG